MANTAVTVTPRSILSPHATTRRLKEMPAPMTVAPDMPPASAPIPITDNGGVRNIIPLLATVFVKHLMPIAVI